MSKAGSRPVSLPAMATDELSGMSVLALRARKAELNAVVAGIRAMMEDARRDIALANAQMALIQREISAREPQRRVRGDGRSAQSRGGFARAASMTGSERSEQASRAARARWGTPDSED